MRSSPNCGAADFWIGPRNVSPRSSTRRQERGQLTGSADSQACPTYIAHGLRVRSEIALDAPVTRVSPRDLEIRLGARRPIPYALPDGHLLARIEVPGGGSSLTGGRGGYVWRVDGLCDIAFDQTRRTARVHMDPDAAEEFVSLLLPSFLADMLALDGRCVVHASAIEVGGAAIAFIGGSGVGKSTLAALCCIAGARLVTDDVLRVELREGAAWCFSGSHALRLRPAAAVLAEHLQAATRRSTLDARTAVFPDAVGGATFPIAAVVAPRWARDSTELRVERLRGSAALVELLRSPRSIGWIDPDRARTDLNVLADIVATVPLYRAQLPWEPLINPALGRTLLAQIGIEADARASH
jgi:hypothetical protein